MFRSWLHYLRSRSNLHKPTRRPRTPDRRQRLGLFWGFELLEDRTLPSAMLPGFDAFSLGPTDDGSTGAVSLGFTANFLGQSFNQVYINNNGNVTFDGPMSAYNPFPLGSNGREILAPFLADVDTRTSNPVTYGPGTVDGHQAFGVNWPGVGFFRAHNDRLNYFQMVLIDRSDIAPGSFDIEFNYNQVQWESGDSSGGALGLGGSSARVGWSNGSGSPGTSFELPGGGVPGSFLDNGPAATSLIHNDLGSTVLGRYLWHAWNGTVTIGGPPAVTAPADQGTTEGLSQAFTLGSFTDPSGGACNVDVNWGDGTPDTTFSTSTLGSLGTANHTFAEEGNQSVTVTVTNGVNLSAAASFHVAVGDAGLAATPQAIAATAGGPFNGVAASFIDANPQATAGEFAATIHWGDGGTSVGTVAANGNGGFDVTGGHTYAAAGAEAVTVQITDVGGSTLTAASTAQVVDPGWRVARGQSSTVRFWHSHHGQALIDSFNGGPDSTALAGWLATTFPNLYGANAGAYDLTGQTNAQVAAFYQSLYHAHGRRLEADVLDTALDVYATTTSLGGPDAAQYGFVVTDAGLGAASLNIRHSGAAFGVPNRTTLNVYQVLQAADQQAVNGVLYNGNTHLDCLADGVFDRIDRAGHIW